ncbi:MAG: methionine synthase [Candidatus Omnitrophica bacterium]|nr:methionine synthase [Candidatus Omnitrophota bacterium]
MTLKFFDKIHVEFPIKKIYSRLGFVQGVTQVNEEIDQKIENYISKAELLLDLKGSFLRLPVIKKNSSTINLANNIKLKSIRLAKMLENSSEVVFMGATAGAKIVKEISLDSRGRDVTGAVIFDAVASEFTDAALEWIAKYINSELRRENKILTTRRFSAGYADFTLKNQKIIYESLQMKKLGVDLTEAFILKPEKTVMAVAGIGLINDA